MGLSKLRGTFDGNDKKYLFYAINFINNLFIT